jgi:hypothetical protein
LPEEIFDEVMSPDRLEVSLPKKNEGIKKYNGVACWYWLAEPFLDSAAYFCNISYNGVAANYTASTVGGCAPAFRVV